MKTTTLKDMLIQHPFFKGLSAEHMQFISGCAQNAAFQAEHVIAKEGDKADSFYIIRAGRVAVRLQVFENKPLTVQTLKKGDIFGWSWLFPPYRWTFEAKSLTVVQATVFDAKCLRKKCEQDYELGYKLMTRFAQILTERLAATRLQLMDVYNIKDAKLFHKDKSP